MAGTNTKSSWFERNCVNQINPFVRHEHQTLSIGFVLPISLNPAQFWRSVLGLGAHKIAVPYESLKIDPAGKRIDLAGSTKESLKALPEITYEQ